jgi:GNAT superfamily N-acetyltransferase
MSLVVGRVRDRKGLREFCALPLRLHPRDRYVPMARAAIAGWWRGGGPHEPVALYLVRDGGDVVGRTCVHREPALDAKLGRRAQLFGLTEFVDDDAAATLFDLITHCGRGTRALFGPVGLLPNQTGGVITSGFDERGFLDSAWNPAYYPATYERHGFARRFEADTWLCDLAASSGTDADALFPFDDARISAERLVLRHGSRRHFGAQLELLRTMLNASFAQREYYTEIDADSLAAQTAGLAYLLDESLLLWLEKAGRPVAFVVTVPDISTFLMRVGGDLGPIGQLRLLATRARYRREAVLIIKGTVPDEQGRGYATLLSRELYRNLRAGGYHTLRSTFVERDNPASAAQYPRMGGRPLHGYTFYQKDL